MDLVAGCVQSFRSFAKSLEFQHLLIGKILFFFFKKKAYFCQTMRHKSHNFLRGNSSLEEHYTSLVGPIVRTQKMANDTGQK